MNVHLYLPQKQMAGSFPFHLPSPDRSTSWGTQARAASLKLQRLQAEIWEEGRAL